MHALGFGHDEAGPLCGFGHSGPEDGEFLVPLRVSGHDAGLLLNVDGCYPESTYWMPVRGEHPATRVGICAFGCVVEGAAADNVPGVGSS
jgi:hypothetical protein